MTFRISTVTVGIDFWFVAVITLMLIIFPESNAAFCFVMCIVHEVGHLLAMLICGKRTEKISLGYFGMKIVTEKSFLSPIKESFIAVSGPLVNIFFAFIFYIYGNHDYTTVNLGLAFFNLLPVTMLDGGHIVSAFFPDSKLHRKLSLACAVLLLAVGFAVAIYSKENFTILIVSLYLLIGVMCKKKQGAF